jgi:hypothetical protein
MPVEALSAFCNPDLSVGSAVKLLTFRASPAEVMVGARSPRRQRPSTTTSPGLRRDRQSAPSAKGTVLPAGVRQVS